MKKNVRILFLLGMLFSFFSGQSQTLQQIQEIIKEYNLGLIHQNADRLTKKSEKDKKEAIRFAQVRNLPVSEFTESGKLISIKRITSQGVPLYYRTFNRDAAKSTRTDHINSGGSTGFNLDGQDMTAYVWDGGHPRASHQEYTDNSGNSRVSIMDSPLERHFHSAHVTGTIAAKGVQVQAKGMAPKSKVRAYQWDDDIGEATTASADGMLVSNHSYGLDSFFIFIFGQSWMFGAYSEESQEWDNLMFNAPYYLMVAAAGNDGSSTNYNANPLAPGYDLLTAFATSKNNIVVANANDANVASNGDLISVSLSATSSPGPTDDLRIKPDITGNGTEVYSTYDNSDTAYGTLSGTSMASPNVAGSLLLLQEHHYNENGNYMKAATLKGLALHTADDAGPAGPDARWGWGLLNAKRAAETISNEGVSSIIQERNLAQGETITFEVTSDGTNPLLASISWTDRPGAAKTSGPANVTTPVLVNDLDIRVIKNSSTYYPWRLTSASSNSNDGDNKVDPYERVDIANASGTYTITISHKGNLTGGSQDFTVIVTGISEEQCTATVPGDITIDEITTDQAKVSWTGSEPFFDLRYRATGNTTWTEISDLTENEYILTNLVPDTTYEVEIRSKCSESEVSDYSATETFKTLPVETDDYIYENGSWFPEHPNLSATEENNIIVKNGTASGSNAIYEELNIKDISVWEDAALEIEGILNLHGNLTIEGDLIFKSGSDFDGELGFVHPDSEINGEAMIHRYMSHNRAYRVVSSPVTTSTFIRDNWQEGVNNPDPNTNLNPNEGFGTHITGSNPQLGFDVTQTGNPSLFRANMTSQQFEVVENTNATLLNAGDAFLLMVRGDRSIDLNDPTNQAAGETILRTKGTLFQGDAIKVFEEMNEGDFILFGNPYQSVLDMNQVAHSSDNINTNHYYVYDPTLGTHGSYVTVLLPDGGNTSDSEANRFIQPGQGAQYVTNASGDSQVIIREEHKAPGNHTATHRELNFENMVTIQLFTQENYNNAGPVHDSFGIVFDDNFTNEITIEDAVMPYNFYENLGINHNGIYLSLEKRKLPQHEDVFQIFTDGYMYSDYTFKILLEGLEDTALYLIDQFNGETILLDSGENIFSFSVDSNDPNSIAEDRFIIAVEKPLGIDANDFGITKLFPNPSQHNTFYIFAPKLNNQNVVVSISEITGKRVYSAGLEVNSNKITVSPETHLSSGVYVVTIEYAGGISRLKLIKE